MEFNIDRKVVRTGIKDIIIINNGSIVSSHDVGLFQASTAGFDDVFRFLYRAVRGSNKPLW